jgi:signal transduction histidine kinase
MTFAGIYRPFTESRTYKGLVYLATPLVLSGLWLALLITIWTLTAVVAITPLVIPALMCVGWTIRGGAAVEAALSRWLLEVDIDLPQPRKAKGFWARGWAVLSDPFTWKAQAWLIFRMTVGFGMALAVVIAVAVGIGFVLAPTYYWAINDGIDVLGMKIDTFPESLILVPIGIAVLVVSAHLLRPLLLVSRSLSQALLSESYRPPRTPTPETLTRRRAVLIHAIVYGGLNLLLILIWLVTGHGYFWPMWALLGLGLPLLIHAWVTYALEHEYDWRRNRLNAGFAIHAGVWVALILFETGVWAASGGGEFWPVWTMLGAGVAVGAHAAALLLGSREREALTERISTLQESRAGAVDVQEAELRRIERDLHDGAQARLVALGMSLGMAEQKLASDPEAARQLLAEARTNTGDALRELRDLARGIHPPVLQDRGLAAAIQALAAASPITVSVSVDSAERPKPPVESAAYFVVAEALANAGKHARATHVDVRITRVGDVLTVTVTDNGMGGADPAGGGLSGLARRVDALDGQLTVESPSGGPTTIRAEMPCG